MAGQPVSGPGQFSQRQDQAPGQPVRVPTGLPYGSGKALEQAQAEVPLPTEPGGPSPTVPGSAPVPEQPSTNPVPPNLLQLLSHPTQRPQEPPTTPATVKPQQVSTRDALNALEAIISTSDSVPSSVMRLYFNLRSQVNQLPPGM